MRNRVIIFEGCDRTGKSTFIEAMKETAFKNGFNPIVFHLSGPTKFDGIKFDNDDMSLNQLSKFDDGYALVRSILEDSEKNVVIFDRSSFGEYVWARYFNRPGKYTDYITSKEFINRYRDIMNQTLYINYHMSDIDKLANRISESLEDQVIFSMNDRKIEENIKYVYDMYKELDKIVKDNDISYLKIDSSLFPSIDHVKDYVNVNFNFLMNYQYLE